MLDDPVAGQARLAIDFRRRECAVKVGDDHPPRRTAELLAQPRVPPQRAAEIGGAQPVLPARVDQSGANGNGNANGCGAAHVLKLGAWGWPRAVVAVGRVAALPAVQKRSARATIGTFSRERTVCI